MPFERRHLYALFALALLTASVIALSLDAPLLGRFLLFPTAVAGVACLCSTLLHRAALRARADGASRCLRCGYDISGLPGSTCPECAADLTIAIERSRAGAVLLRLRDGLLRQTGRVQCRTCGLVYERRSGGVCPRCSSRLLTPPQAPRAPTDPGISSSDAPAPLPDRR